MTRAALFRPLDAPPRPEVPAFNYATGVARAATVLPALQPLSARHQPGRLGQALIADQVPGDEADALATAQAFHSWAFTPTGHAEPPPAEARAAALDALTVVHAAAVQMRAARRHLLAAIEKQAAAGHLRVEPAVLDGVAGRIDAGIPHLPWPAEAVQERQAAFLEMYRSIGTLPGGQQLAALLAFERGHSAEGAAR